LSHPPVILQVVPELDTGGVERSAVDMARAVVDAGGVGLLASEGGRLVHELTRNGGEHVELPLATKNPLQIRANIEKLKQLIKERGVDLVHARSRAPAWSAKFAAEACKVPFVTTFHGTYSGWNNPLKKRYNAVMAQADEVIANSHFIADHIRTHYGINEKKLTVIPRGINFDLFDPEMVSHARLVNLSDAWRLTGTEQVVMLPGRLTRWKGQESLIDAMTQVVDELGRRDIRCLLVGSDQGRTAYTDGLRDRVKALNLQDIVHIADHCDDMPAAYMLTDAVVSASIEPEAFGRVAIEGQAMGRPVIATSHGGAKETVLPGETGWLVHPGETRLLARAIVQVLSISDKRRADIAKRAIAHARVNYTLKQMRDKTLDVYERALGRSGS
jgi:glycosyltransferase involved in cell wall biosynthesis